jgi:hypothetical protein
MNKGMTDPSHVITTLCMGRIISIERGEGGLMECWDGSRPHGAVPWYDML